jgi:hypothetical protein
MLTTVDPQDPNGLTIEEKILLSWYRTLEQDEKQQLNAFLNPPSDKHTLSVVEIMYSGDIAMLKWLPLWLNYMMATVRTNGDKFNPGERRYYTYRELMDKTNPV